jgi:DNA-binding Lrp family transcriptional regulator
MGAESEVLKGLKEITEVKESHLIYGVYDIILRVETETMQELKDAISWKIRRLDKVRSTLTMIVI